MNKIRRKNLQSIIDQLEELKGSLEDLQAEEEEYRDNIPENMQESVTKRRTRPATTSPKPWITWRKSSAASKLPLSERREHEGNYCLRLLQPDWRGQR